MLKKLIVLDLRRCRRLVRRIDTRILPAAMVLDFLSSVDKSNIVRCYISLRNPPYLTFANCGRVMPKSSIASKGIPSSKRSIYQNSNTSLPL